MVMFRAPSTGVSGIPRANTASFHSADVENLELTGRLRPASAAKLETLKLS
jgi:hypothetical protein